MSVAKSMQRVFTGAHGRLVKLTGALGGGTTDGSVLVLRHAGARSGSVRETPLRFINHEGGFLVVASNGGAPSNPGWFHNLRAHPDASVNVGRRDHEVHAEVIGDEDRATPWERLIALDDRWVRYAKSTDRVIPLVHLQTR